MTLKIRRAAVEVSFALAAVVVGACGGATTGERCGGGTHDENGVCYVDLVPQAPNPPASAPADASSNGEDATLPTGSDAGTDSSAVDGGLDVATACLGSTNKFVIGGSGYIHAGPPLVIEGGAGWQVGAYSSVGNQPDHIVIRPGINWSIEMSTASLGKPLLPGTYTDVQRAAFTDPNHPGLDVSGDGAGCNTVTGQFTVIEMSSRPPPNDAGAPVPTVTSFTATFEQHCEGAPSANVGCIHIQQ